MAGQQEPTPGAPGGPSGPRSATAATFVVNDASLRSLHSTFDLLIKDVGRFNASLIALEKGNKTLESVRQKLAALGIAGGGTAAVAGGSGGGQPLSAGQTTRVGDGRAQNGGDARTSAQLSGGFQGNQGGGAVGRTASFLTGTLPGRFISGGIASAYAAGSFYKRSMGDISDLDLLFQQQRASGFGGGARGFLTGAGGGSHGIGGYQSAADLMAGVGNVQGALGGGLGSARTRGALTQAGQLATLNPAAGLGGSTAAMASLYAPSTAIRARSLGISTIGQGGKVNSPQAVYQQIQRLVFHGQKITPNMIGEGMAPGAPLYQTLIGLGLDANAMEQFRYYALAQANLGGSAARVEAAMSYANTGKGSSQARADAKAAGLDTIRAAQNRLGGAQTRRTAEAGAEGKDALEFGFTQLARATDDLTDVFRGLNQQSHGLLGGGAALSSFLPGSAGGAKGLLTSGTQGLFSYELFKNLPKMAGKVGGRGGAMLGGAAGQAMGMSGMMGTPVFVTNMPGGGGFGSGGGDPFGGGGGGGSQEERELGRFARARNAVGKGLRDFGGGALRGFKPMTGAFARSGLAGTGFEGVSAMEGLGLGVAGGAVLAAPFAAGTAAVLGIHGEMMKTKEIQYNSSGDMADSLTKLIGRFRKEGYTNIPAAMNEWHNVIQPLIRKSSSNPEKQADLTLRAFTALAHLMTKYRGDVTKTNASKGVSASGNRFYGFEAGNAPGMSIGIGQPGGSSGDTGGSNVAPSTKPAASSSAVSGVIGTAESFIGKPYKWGGSNPRTSFDCSGLTQWAYGQNGIKLPRTAAQQQGVGTDVPFDQLVPGDLVFYGSPAHHVAMYVGNGMMIEAPHTGATIRNTALRKGTNAKRIIGGGAGFKGTVAAGGSATQGDSGLGPKQAPSSNLNPSGSTSIFGDEMSALANVLTPPSLSPSAAGGMASRLGTGTSGPGNKSTGMNDSGGAPSGPKPSGTVGSWVKTALGLLHLDFDKYGAAIATIIQHESGGNPRAINKWDSNWKAGHPSEGIMQTIPSTFKRWALPGHGDIWNPVDNIAAATRYAMGRYGSIDNVPGIKSLHGGGSYKGYYQGSYSTSEGPAYLHNEEMIVPARAARKVRSMLARRGQEMQSAPSAMALMSGGGGHQTIVHLTAPIQVVGKATQQDARDFLHMVKAEMEKSHELDFVGSGA